MKPVSFLAIDGVEKAKAFYVETLGLSLVEESPYALVFEHHGHFTRIQIVETLDPAPFTVHGWMVGNIEEKVRSLVSKGITFVIYEGLPQDQFGIWNSPSGAKIAWFTDPSGNILSLTQAPI